MVHREGTNLNNHIVGKLIQDDAVILRQVREMLDAAQVPGATVGLMVDGQVWSEGVGHEDVDRAGLITASARFGVYSVTKTVIATIVLKLVEAGSISLDAPVQDFLPGAPVGRNPDHALRGIQDRSPVEIPGAGPESTQQRVQQIPESLSGFGMTVRQLLNHTGGVPDYGGLADYHEDVHSEPGNPWTAEHFLTRTLANGLLFAPGTGWRYSNVGYLLLRLMIERVSGESFREVVRHYVAKPLGLREFGVADSLEAMADLTPGYTGEPMRNIISHYHPGWVSHGLVTSSVSDLARFLDALMTGAFVTEASLQEMLVAVPVGASHPWMTVPSYGAGLMIDTANRFGIVAGHTGGGPGYSTAAYHFPDVDGHRVTSVALVNRDGSDLATDIAFTMVQGLAGKG